MTLVLSHENTKNMTEKELLQLCVDTYANPANYEPYEKDYGVGRPVEKVPAFASERGQFARRVKELIADRQGTARPLTPMQEAYLQMFNALEALRGGPQWDGINTEDQDRIEAAIESGKKHL